MPNDEQAIRDLITTWMEASARGDIQTVLGLMDEDVVFLVPGQLPMRGREAFASASKSMADQQMQIDGQSEVQEIRINGDWAYCWNRLSVTITAPNKDPMRRQGYTLTIFKKNSENRWVLFRDANLLGPPSKE